MVTLYNTYTRYMHVHDQEFIVVIFFARTGGNRNLAIIRPTHFFCQLRYIIYSKIEGHYLPDLPLLITY